MKKISETKKISGKQIITIIGLIISLIGGAFSLWYGIRGKIQDPFYEFYYNIPIALSIVVIIGDLLGFYKKAVGICISFVIAIIGFFLTLVLGMGGYDLGLILPILLIFIGGIIGFITNYENLKDWMEKRRKEGEKLRGEKKREVTWEKKLWIPGVILLMLGVIYISLEIAMIYMPGGIPLGIVFMIIGPVLIIYSAIKLRKQDETHKAL